MAGTIFLSADVFFDVRTVDFEWIVDSLRSRKTIENSSALSAALRSHDEYGMDLLDADKLDSTDFRRLGEAFNDLTTNLRSIPGQGGLLMFLQSVQAAIQNDTRWSPAV